MSAYRLSIIDSVQPYLLQKTERYYRYPIYHRGIQEFFGFCTMGMEKAEKDGTIQYRMVPEVGNQLLICVKDNKVEIAKINPDEELGTVHLRPSTDYFGVRFIPGIVSQVEHFLSHRAALKTIRHYFLLEKGFKQRARIFQHIFDDFLEQTGEHNDNPQVPSIYAIVSETNGDIRVDELSRNLGYSQRYMSKMIRSDFGMAPKTLCKYIKFQKSLEYLGVRNDMDITEVSSALGYYDQSHFVKYFKEFTGVTPRSYVNMVRSDRLYQKIESVGDDMRNIHNQETFSPKEWKTLFLAE